MDAVLFAVVMVATLLAAALTVPAGFGLATMLTPIMLLWLDPHLAIAAVAVIHAAHNGWKLLLLKTHLDVSAVKRYGWAMVLGALIGALMSTSIDQKPLLIVVGFALILLPLLSQLSDGLPIDYQKQKTDGADLVQGLWEGSQAIKGLYEQCSYKEDYQISQHTQQLLLFWHWLLISLVYLFTSIRTALTLSNSYRSSVDLYCAPLSAFILESDGSSDGRKPISEQ